MLRLSDLIIDVKSLGERLWLTDISTVFEYKDNRRTDTVTGHRYTVCLPDKNFEKIGIKIDGKRLLEPPENGYISVKFEGLEIFAYSLNGTIQIGGKAANITALANPKG